MTKPSKKIGPDIKDRNTSPEYVAELIAKCKARHGYTTQAAVAARIGVSLSVLKHWKRGAIDIPYTAQYALESLAGIN